MLHLFQSNDMHQLVDAFLARNHALAPDPFEPLTVVVQSYGMGQWLKLRLAERAGISANVDTLLPANLVWRLYQHYLDELEIPQESPFSIEHLTWRLMKIFPQCDGDDYQLLQAFLSAPGDTQVRQFQLAEKIATLYDQYLIYRPDWILGWDSGDESRGPESWQRDLWQRLTANEELKNRQHRARLHRTLLSRIQDNDIVPAGVPDRIAVFGVSALPVIHLEALRALATRIDVDLYFLNPCAHYWGDIVSGKDQARHSIRRLLGREDPDASLSDDDYIEVGNPILSSMGKQGREYLELLLDIDEIESAEAFIEPEDDSMLAALKRDILNLEFGGEFGGHIEPTPIEAPAGDYSIQIHACHSRMREVEVLYDQLLRLVDLDATITPADIIVMMPDVGAYAPYIEAVFQDRLYYTIADRALNQESPVMVAFTTLLGLPDARLTATEVMDLLEIPTIARKFGLHEDDLLTIGQWIGESGIRWELTGEEKLVRWQVPGSSQNTWQFGIDRMLLGYAMESGAGVYDGILPFEIDSGQAHLLGVLCSVVELLASYRARLSETQTVADWTTTLLTLVDDFFEPWGDEEMDLARLRDLVIRLGEETDTAGYDEAMSSRMVRYWFERQLSVAQQSRGFISGGVTFATLVPMRSIPFKVVCLLGMNDGEYPREDRPVTFDLMASEGYRKGDRSKRSDDRYLFLEALLSAEQCFYISFVGRSIKDNQPRPPSVLVGELTDYLSRVFTRVPLIQHPLQPFSEEYYDPASEALITYRSDWFDALQAPKGGEGGKPFIDIALPDDPELAAKDIDDLGQFFRNPARTFMRRCLGVYFEEDTLDLRDTESFNLDALERYQLADSALHVLIEGESVSEWRQRAVASGLVMAGELGSAHLSREFNRADAVFEEIRDLIIEEPVRVQGALAIPEYPDGLTGIVSGVFPNTILNYRSGTLRKRQLMEAWINHLFVNATQREVPTLTVSTDRGQVVKTVIEPVDPKQALGYLIDLLRLYHEGMVRPLPFLPETSFIYIKALNDGNEPGRAAERALGEWNKDMAGGEGNDRSYRRLFDFPADFDARFHDVAERVYQPLLQRWSELK